jgi:hypothetical protein
VCRLRLVCKEWNKILGDMRQVLFIPLRMWSVELTLSTKLPKLRILNIYDFPHVLNPECILDFSKLIPCCGPLVSGFENSVDKDYDPQTIEVNIEVDRHVEHEEVSYSGKFNESLRQIVASCGFSTVKPFVEFQLCDVCLSHSGAVCDETVKTVILNSPYLRNLDLRCCEKLLAPIFLLLDAYGQCAHIDEIKVDGCFRLIEALLLIYHGRAKIDILEETFPKGHMEVVILTEKFEGKWVHCVVCNESAFSNHRARCYDIFVSETIKYDHAVGFSASMAYNIRRQHMRHVEKIKQIR